jgi:hypothetical protein
VRIAELVDLAALEIRNNEEIHPWRQLRLGARSTITPSGLVSKRSPG